VLVTLDWTEGGPGWTESGPTSISGLKIIFSEKFQQDLQGTTTSKYWECYPQKRLGHFLSSLDHFLSRVDHAVQDGPLSVQVGPLSVQSWVSSTVE